MQHYKKKKKHTQTSILSCSLIIPLTVTPISTLMHAASVILLSVQWHIKQQPIDVLTKVGEDAKFFIVTSPGQVSYNWCFNDQSISDDNADYRGARASELVVLKSLSKHCGSYKCIVTDSNMHVHIPSIPASLEIGI